MNRSIDVLSKILFVVAIIAVLTLGILLGVNHPMTWVMVFAVIIIPIIRKKIISDSLIIWKEEYSVGIEEMDNDHKKLISLINRLQSSVSQYTSQEFEERALAGIVDYTKTHFKREEDLLEKNGYAELDAHKKEHEHFANEINNLASKYTNNPNITIAETLDLLKDWLIRHINGTDKKYGKVLNSKGIQ